VRLRDSLVAIALALAFASPAHAVLGTAYNELVCRDPQEVAQTFKFTTTFVGVSNCSKLCVQAFKVCERDVLDAASCQLAFANDFIAFDSAVDCAGLRGAALSDCKAGWAADRNTWRNSILAVRGNALSFCQQLGSICLGCEGH
jgi:hypothetical protein